MPSRPGPAGNRRGGQSSPDLTEIDSRPRDQHSAQHPWHEHLAMGLELTPWNRSTLGHDPNKETRRKHPNYGAFRCVFNILQLLESCCRRTLPASAGTVWFLKRSRSSFLGHNVKGAPRNAERLGRGVWKVAELTSALHGSQKISKRQAAPAPQCDVAPAKFTAMKMQGIQVLGLQSRHSEEANGHLTSL